MSFPVPRSRTIPYRKRIAHKIRMSAAAGRGSCSRRVFLLRFPPRGLCDCRLGETALEEAALRFIGSAEDTARLLGFRTGSRLPCLLGDDVPVFCLFCENVVLPRLFCEDVVVFRLFCEDVVLFRLLFEAALLRCRVSGGLCVL